MSVSPDRSTLPAGCVGSPDPCTIVPVRDDLLQSGLGMGEATWPGEPRRHGYRAGRRARRRRVGADHRCPPGRGACARSPSFRHRSRGHPSRRRRPSGRTGRPARPPSARPPVRTARGRPWPRHEPAARRYLNARDAGTINARSRAAGSRAVDAPRRSWCGARRGWHRPTAASARTRARSASVRHVA